jgi:hypothetical protein
MVKIIRKIFFVTVLISLATFILYGCGSKYRKPRAVIRINDYTLNLNEFNEMFKEASLKNDTPEIRHAFVDNLITRKLLLYEAQKQKLDKGGDFLKAIQNFWEQSLFKIVIDNKTKELAGSIKIYNTEIEQYYDQLAKENPDIKSLSESYPAIKWQLMRQKQTEAMDEWINNLKKKTRIEIDKAAVGIKE